MVEDDVTTIRLVRQEDTPFVAALWKDGLRQTAEVAAWWKKPLVSWIMPAEERRGLDETSGDLGPNGANLMRYWGRSSSSDDDDRAFYVALRRDSNNGLCGCVGVIQGTAKVDPDARKSQENQAPTTASIWRLSVSESARRKGVGTKLMEEAEAWAFSKGCTRMRLVTTNRAAQQFYLSLGYTFDYWLLPFMSKSVVAEEKNHPSPLE
jgi:GNAT superfamily N-acetyltransferase